MTRDLDRPERRVVIVDVQIQGAKTEWYLGKQEQELQTDGASGASRVWGYT